MSNRRTGSSRRKRSEDFVKDNKPAITLPTFLLILLGLLALAVIWSASRVRSAPIFLDSTGNYDTTIASIRRSKSWRRIDDATLELRQQMQGKSPREAETILKVLEVASARQKEVATTEEQRTKAWSNQLLALQGLCLSAPNGELQQQRTTELLKLGSEQKDHQDDDVSRKAFLGLLTAARLVLRDGIDDEADGQRFGLLVPAWIAEASGRFPNDLQITELIAMLISSYPRVANSDAQLKAIVQAVTSGYRNSSNPQIVSWANRLEVIQFFDERGVARLLADPNLGANTSLDELQAVAGQLVAMSSNPVALQKAEELAHVCEGFSQPERARKIIEPLLALDLTAIPQESRESLLKEAQLTLARQAQLGQSPELELKLADGTSFSSATLRQSVVLLLFYREAKDFLPVAGELGSILRLQSKGLRLFLVGPPLGEREQLQVAAAVFGEGPYPELPWVEERLSAELAERFQVSYTPFPVTLDEGRIISQGTPLLRGMIWLEQRLFGN